MAIRFTATTRAHRRKNCQVQNQERGWQDPDPVAYFRTSASKE